MRKEYLSNISGAGIDPCLCENTKLELNAGEEKSFIIILGQYESLRKLKAA